MADNNGGVQHNPIHITRAEKMARYDALPAWARKIIQDAPLSMTIVNTDLMLLYGEKANRADILKTVKRSTRATYGKSYPIDLVKF